MRFETICTVSPQKEYLGLWLGLDNAPALEFTAARDEWIASGYAGAWDRDDFAAMAIGDSVTFEDMDSNEFRVTRKA